MPDFTTFPGPHVRGDGGSRTIWEAPKPAIYQPLSVFLATWVHVWVQTKSL